MRQPVARAAPDRQPASRARSQVPPSSSRGAAHAVSMSTKASSKLTRTSPALQPPSQRRETWKSLHRQHHPRVGRPPQDRIAVVEPGKDAVRVGTHQRRDGQIAAGGQQTVGPTQRAFHGGNRRPGARNGIMLKCLSLPDGECSSAVELRIVDPAVAGSIPVTHPNSPHPTVMFLAACDPDRARPWVRPRYPQPSNGEPRAGPALPEQSVEWLQQEVPEAGLRLGHRGVE